jgi:hypothetical protein
MNAGRRIGFTLAPAAGAMIPLTLKLSLLRSRPVSPG